MPCLSLRILTLPSRILHLTLPVAAIVQDFVIGLVITVVSQTTPKCRAQNILLCSWIPKVGRPNRAQQGHLFSAPQRLGPPLEIVNVWELESSGDFSFTFLGTWSGMTQRLGSAGIAAWSSCLLWPVWLFTAWWPRDSWTSCVVVQGFKRESTNESEVM